MYIAFKWFEVPNTDNDLVELEVIFTTENGYKFRLSNVINPWKEGRGIKFSCNKRHELETITCNGFQFNCDLALPSAYYDTDVGREIWQSFSDYGFESYVSVVKKTGINEIIPLEIFKTNKTKYKLRQFNA